MRIRIAILGVAFAAAAAHGERSTIEPSKEAPEVARAYTPDEINAVKKAVLEGKGPINPLLVKTVQEIEQDPFTRSIYLDKSAVSQPITLEETKSVHTTPADVEKMVTVALAKVKQLGGTTGDFDRDVPIVAKAGDAAIRQWISQKPERRDRYPVICDLTAHVNAALFNRLKMKAESQTTPNLHWWARVTDPKGKAYIVDPSHLQFGNTPLGSPVSRFSLTVLQLQRQLEQKDTKISETGLKKDAARLDAESRTAAKMFPPHSHATEVAHGPLGDMLRDLMTVVETRERANPGSGALKQLRALLVAHEESLRKQYSFGVL